MLIIERGSYDKFHFGFIKFLRPREKNIELQHGYIKQHYCTILFSLPVNYLKDLRDFGLDKGGVDPFSPKYRLSSII